MMLTIKKTRLLHLVLVFIISLSSIPIIQSDTNHLIAADLQEFILDQHQENDTYETSIHQRVSLAQEFTPSLSPLTKVEVKINKPRKTDRSLVLSLRESLTGNDIVTSSVNAVDIPYFTNWIEFDIPDVDVTVGKPYYIVLSSSVYSDDSYRWKYDYNDTADIYPNGTLYRYFHTSDIWEKVESDEDYVDACFRTYSYISHTDLVCDGYFNWTDIKPGQDNLTGMFTIENQGTPYSKLHWKIISWPSWGTWSFSQLNGTKLRPEDGLKTITIHVIAPNFNVPDEYLGKITIINTEDANDTEYVQARLVTPKNKIKSDNNIIDFLKDDGIFQSLRIKNKWFNWYYFFLNIFKVR
jgi:hypothetical protein